MEVYSSIKKVLPIVECWVLPKYWKCIQKLWRINGTFEQWRKLKKCGRRRYAPKCWNARVQVDVAATEHGVIVAVRDVRVRMHRKVKEGELADCNGTSGHRGARWPIWARRGQQARWNAWKWSAWRPRGPEPSIDAEPTIACAAFRGGLSAVSPRGKNLL